MSGETNKALQEAMAAAAQVALENAASDLLYGIREGRATIAPWPERPCKIVFLDFDGVLNSEASTAALGTRYKFAAGSVAALNQILVRSLGYVVITSSWRDNWKLMENARFLQQAGVTGICVLGKTPTLDAERGQEIEDWLRKAPFPIEAFVILDDRTDMGLYRDRLVLVDPKTGLSENHVEPAIKILNRPWVQQKPGWI